MSGGLDLGRTPPIGMDVTRYQASLAEIWPKCFAVTITASTNAGSEAVIFANATSGNLTVALPPVRHSEGVHYFIKKIDDSANTVTLDADGEETIDEETTVIISAQYNAVHIYCDGIEWWILNKGEDEVMARTLIQILSEFQLLRVQIEQLNLQLSLLTKQYISSTDVNLEV